jgi:hypothetical protein
LIEEVEKGAALLIFLREGKAVINSLYWLYQEREWSKETMEGFIHGPHGVDKYLQYLKALNKFLCDTSVIPEVYFFEDNFDKDSVRQLPQILGIDYDMTDTEAELVFEESSMKRVKSGTHKDIALSDAKEKGSTYRTGTPED